MGHVSFLLHFRENRRFKEFLILILILILILREED